MYLSEYQTVDAYEQALARHAQSVRWMKALPCTCINSMTGQADPSCSICKGRGVRYITPAKAHIQDELAYCSFTGVVTLKHPCISNSAYVLNQVTKKQMTVSSYIDSTHLLLAFPYPKPSTPLSVMYDLSLQTSYSRDLCSKVKLESATRLVVRPNSVINSLRDKSYYSTIASTSLVTINGTTVPVVSTDRDLLTLNITGITLLGEEDIILATYKAATPFKFLVHSISDKVRWELGYVQEQAQAIVVVPYYIKASVNDLFTILSAEQTGTALIDPTFTLGNDIITNYYDIVKILSAYDSDGNEIDISGVSIYNRNELSWITKPTKKYVVQFLYNPTFAVIPALSTLRNAEDKAFVNRLNVIEYTRLTGKVTF